MPRLENWYIKKIGNIEIAYGNVYDDPRCDKTTGQFADGHLIQTSEVMAIDRNEKYILTVNTKYKLGKKLEVK